MRLMSASHEISMRQTRKLPVVFYNVSWWFHLLYDLAGSADIRLFDLKTEPIPKFPEGWRLRYPVEVTTSGFTSIVDVGVLPSYSFFGGVLDVCPACRTK